MIFINRVDAGRHLANALSSHKGQNVVVFALPRGGVVLGALRPFDWRVFPPKLVHADRLSDPLAENDVYEQEQSGLW